jgi:hypothetical protein
MPEGSPDGLRKREARRSDQPILKEAEPATMSVARLPAVARIRTKRALIRYHLVGESRLADTPVDASFRSAPV